MEAPPRQRRRFDAVVSDIDGCLSPEHSGPMDAARLAAIATHNALAERDGDRPVVTVCSGRPQPFAEAMARLLGVRSLPLVAENGVWLYHPADNRYDMDPRINAGHLAAIRDLEGWVRAELGPLGVTIQPGKAASASLFHPETDRLRGLEPRVREEAGRRGWPVRVSMTWFYINCDLAHVSKATGLDRLFAAAGLERLRVAGIGDTMSDRAIAERVAWFACPANADERLRAEAAYVSMFAETAGVLDILARLA